MIKKDFNEFLLIKEKDELLKIDWENNKNEWLLKLDALYKLFEKSLQEYVINNRISITYNNIEITEEYIGSYKAKSMTIKFGGEKILLKPIGTNLIGAKGRVDMSGSYGSTKIVLVNSNMKGLYGHIKVSIHVDTDGLITHKKHKLEEIIWEWKFSALSPKLLYIPVNEETIYSTIMELSNG
jgi:hypothetical protein